jgi:signal transduction histidine kinase
MKTFFHLRNIVLVLLVIVGSATLVVINYYSIKTTSSVRAYINGESRYSKGQKDASRHLISYLVSEDARYWQLFNEELQVPIGDSLARVGFSNGATHDQIFENFLKGKNHPDDIDGMIWLFRQFRDVSFMKDAIRIWTDADELIGRLKTLGTDIHARVDSKNVTASEKNILVQQINELTTALTIKERAFSDLMGATARTINGYLFLFNLCCTILITATVIFCSYKSVGQLLKTQSELKGTNKDLNETNQELDNFIYAASHDLKAPINNLEGLLSLLRSDQNASSKEILDRMDYSIAKLRKTICALTEVIKHDKSPVEDVEVNCFETLVNEFVNEHHHVFEKGNVAITSSFDVNAITYSTTALKSILQNLLINAIKYRSNDRQCVIQVSSYKKEQAIVLEVKDNGLGIDLVKYQKKLFKMFSRLHDHVEGTGMGLYMVKRIVEKYGGAVEIESAPNEGTTFRLMLGYAAV